MASSFSAVSCFPDRSSRSSGIGVAVPGAADIYSVFERAIESYGGNGVVSEELTGLISGATGLGSGNSELV